MEQAVSDGRLVPAERRFTTQTALEREKRILKIEREGRGAVVPTVSAKDLHDRLVSSRSRLNEGAARRSRAHRHEPERVVAVQGYAGTG